ncbi:MAG: hypothetical protein PHD15_05530 [Clostridia bacterium]|nr:hypothetical protein [Clostridia bacterium]MDD4387194.1 hypothetical protein [Clostridia bacterium]
MRYYLYLDKEFLKSLFASVSEVDFDIEIMEFSVQKGETLTKDINIAPNANQISGRASWQKKDKDLDDKNESRKQVTSGVTLFVGEKNTYNTIVERRYINIEDVSGIKNLAFYDKLVKRLEEMCNKEDCLCIENGKICPCKLKNLYTDIDDTRYPKNNQFFYINNKYIWIDSNNLATDLFFLSTITSEVKVIGFTINKIDNIDIIKAIAIFIE